MDHAFEGRMDFVGDGSANSSGVTVNSAHRAGLASNGRRDRRINQRAMAATPPPRISWPRPEASRFEVHHRHRVFVAAILGGAGQKPIAGKKEHTL